MASADIGKINWAKQALSAATAAIFLTLILGVIRVSAANAAAGDIVITEFMANPVEVTDSKGEWIEIQNVSAEAIDLDSWDVDGSTITPSFLLQTGERAVICRNQDATLNGGVICDAQASGMSLSNTSDTINLRDENNEVVNSVSYSGNVVAGHSTIVSSMTPDYDNQYSVSNFGTPANNTLLDKSAEIRVHAVIDKNANGSPDWKFNDEMHEQGWDVRLYRDIGASQWSYLGEVTTSGKAFKQSATFDTVPGEYYACLVSKAGFSLSFARTITGWWSFPDNSQISDSPASDEEQRCIAVDNTADTATSLVFGSIEELL